MIVRKDVICYGFVDAYEVLHTQVVGDCSDTVFLTGYGSDGMYHTFEAEAYHLRTWCERHGFKYLRAEKEVKFNLTSD